MSIPGQIPINIGSPNSPVNSDSLYTAFNAIQNNFTQLFSTSSPITTLTAGNGITISNSTSSSYLVTNSGVISLTAGNNIIITAVGGSPSSNGSLVISSTSTSNGSGTVTSIGATSNSILVTNSPITTSGNIQLELVTIPDVNGSYQNANITVDEFGRIISATSGVSSGTVTSISATAGNGISVSGSPITSSGTLTINNTGVTSIVAGSGISISQATGAVTITNTGGGSGGGTVTRVGVISNSLSVSGSPIVSSGNITIELPSNLTANVVTANTANIANILGNQIQINAANSNVGIQLTTSTNNATQTGLITRKSRGTTAAPSAISTGDSLLNIQSEGYTSYGVYQSAGSMSVQANGIATSSSSYIPSDVIISSTSSTIEHSMRLIATGSLLIPGRLGQTLFGNVYNLSTMASGRARGTDSSTIANVQVGDYTLRNISYGYTTNGTISFGNIPGFTYSGEYGFIAVAIPTGTQSIPSDFVVKTTSTTYTTNTLTFSNTGNLTASGSIFASNSNVTISNAASFTGTTVSVTGNITGGNITTVGLVSTTGNITANIITANYFAGNGGNITYQQTNTFYVDPGRTQNYTPTGSQISPFFTITAAISAATTAGYIDSNPAFIVLMENITENVTLKPGIWLTSLGTGTHGSPVITGTVTVTSSTGTTVSNHYSISNLRIVAPSNGHGILFTGTAPQRLYVRDMWIDANGTGDGIYMDNIGSGSTLHLDIAHLTHSGSGDIYCINVTKGNCYVTDIETTGATQVAAVQTGAVMTIDGSELDAVGDVVCETYGTGSLTITNSIITNTFTNGNGIKINSAGSTVTVGQCLFNIPVGTGSAVWYNPSATLYGSNIAFASITFFPVTNTTIDPRLFPIPLAVAVGTIASPILYGDITSYSVAQDWDLIDNNASALSFDTAGKAGIINLVTTNGSEGVTMSGTLKVTGNANVGGIETTATLTANTTATITNTIPIVVNGVTYKIMLTT